MGNKHQKPKNEVGPQPAQPPQKQEVHPVNNLKLVAAPAYAAKEYSSAPMHFFEEVKRRNHKKGIKQVLVITPKSIYCGSKNGIIDRCARVAEVKEILVGEEGELGLKFNDNFDMLFEMPADKQQEVAFIIQSIQRVGELPVAVVTKYTSSVPREKLNLKEPPKLTVETALERMRDKAPQPAQSPSG
eukprot:TRINITY_DN2517_c0_g1_i4.p1 TRINITY_DN2517_c0_g1~~TRINITY_DN2517_c0_g1_i4.p1  ORF type:complete len:187 (+),score=29.17 TRINITY_DN2517_c0_g1_i4:45-605(+)